MFNAVGIGTENKIHTVRRQLKQANPHPNPPRAGEGEIPTDFVSFLQPDKKKRIIILIQIKRKRFL